MPMHYILTNRLFAVMNLHIKIVIWGMDFEYGWVYTLILK